MSGSSSQVLLIGPSDRVRALLQWRVGVAMGVTRTPTATEAVQLADGGAPRLLVIDGDGPTASMDLDTCRRARSLQGIPILLAGARGSVRSMVGSLFSPSAPDWVAGLAGDQLHLEKVLAEALGPLPPLPLPAIPVHSPTTQSPVTAVLSPTPRPASLHWSRPSTPRCGSASRSGPNGSPSRETPRRPESRGGCSGWRSRVTATARGHRGGEPGDGLQSLQDARAGTHELAGAEAR